MGDLRAKEEVTPSYLLFAAVVAFFPLARPLEAGDLVDLQKRGFLRVAVWSQARPQLFSLGEGTEPGFEREILQGFGNLHRVRLEVMVVKSLEECMTTVASGVADVAACALTSTESRRKLVDFTAEIFVDRQVVVSRKPHRVVQTLEELRSERVGVVRGSSWHESALAAGVPAANVDDSFTSVEAAVAAMREGKVSALVMSVTLTLLERQRDPSVQVGLFVGPRADVGFVVQKGRHELLAALNDYLSNLRRTATWSRLLVKYFGEGVLEILRNVRQE